MNDADPTASDQPHGTDDGSANGNGNGNGNGSGAPSHAAADGAGAGPDGAGGRESRLQARVEAPDRYSPPVGLEHAPRLAFAVIAVGASAGGLEAYVEFLKAVRPDSGMAFVLIQHLSPKHESIMADILGRHTEMTVLQVEDGMTVAPNHVYVIRPGYTMTLREGRLHLGANAAQRGHRRPIDDFYRSLAEEQRERAICVTLSGTGSNGTAGAEQVKAVGGFCIAQDPETAKFPAMPRSLIDAGLADAILRPSEMFATIARYASNAYSAGSDLTPETIAERERSSMNAILSILRTRVRHDFSGYKKPTLVRRIQRRMSLLQIETMSDYAMSLRQSPTEVSALADDLMIHVTGFFRDEEVWESLRERVIVPMVHEKPDGASIRAWVTACSSGEEAYSLAMLLVEAAEAVGKKFDIKIFATDTAERSLAQARAGQFPGGIESEVPPARLDRFFEKHDPFYRVKKDLRELIVFAPQNVLQDPPFSRLDLCTCRNLLIYIEADVQRRVLSMLHFGLREGGALLLGNSETVSGSEDLFEPIDKKNRIFRRIGPTRHGQIAFAPMRSAIGRDGPTLGEDPGPSAPRMLTRTTIAQLATRKLLDQHTPAAVVVDREGQIVYFHGSTDRFLSQPRGEPTRDVLELVRDELRGALRNALHGAMISNHAAHARDVVLGEGAERRRLIVTATPLDTRRESLYFLVSFTELPELAPVALASGGDAEVRLSEDLRRVQHELQSTIEELQTSNEEMKASHEEVTSVNEELQSTNEELETSKEELQSLNEELTTVNAQLQAKMEELERMTSDLASLLSSTDIAVIFLDTTFRVRRYTPASKDLIELIPTDVGRPLVDLALKFDDPNLLADAQAVLNRLVPMEREVVSGSGHTYARRVLPYRTADNRIDGVVVTFVNISDRKRAEEAMRESVALYRALIGNLPGGAVFVVDADLRYRLAEGQALEHWGLTTERLQGRTLRDALPPEAAAQLEPFFRRTLAGETLQHEHDGNGREFVTHGVPLRDAAGKIYAALAVSYDITDRKRLEVDLRRHAARAAFQMALSDALRPLADPAQIQAEAARVLGQQLRVDRVHYGVTSDDGAQPSLTGHRGSSPLGASLALSMRAGQTVVLPDVANAAELPKAERQAYLDVGVRSLIRVPLVKDRLLVADLAVHHSSPRMWSADEVMLIEETAERTWAAIERARATASMRASDARFRTIMEGARDFAILMTDPQGSIVVWNAGATALFGYEPAEVIGKGAALIFTPEDRSRGADKAEMEVARDAGSAPDERWHIRRDGSTFWGSGVMARLPGPDGSSTMGFVKILHDATDRRRAEEAVRTSEERLRLIVNNVGDHAIYLLDPTGHITAWWHGAERMTGYPEAEAIGRQFAFLFSPEDQQEGVPEGELRAARDEGQAEREGFRVRRDGSRFWVNEVLTAIRNDAGALVGFAKISRDLTERKENEDALRVSEERSRLAIEAAHMGFWDWDIVSNTVKWEPTHNRMLGLPAQQTVGTPEEFMMCVHPEDREAVTAALTMAVERKADYIAEFRALHPDGEVRWIAGYGRVYDDHEEGAERRPPTRMIGGVLDVTERKRADLERLELLDRERDARNAAEEANRVKDDFLATLSHELRTPLSAIMIWTKLLSTPELSEPHRVEGLEAIQQSADAQKQLIDDLLDSSRITSGKLRLEMADVPLVPLLRAAIDTIEPTADAKDVTLNADLDERAGVVRADPARLRQIIWNLLTNAVKFTPTCGRIDVRLRRSGDNVEVSVSDTGRGISRDFLPHIFERFSQSDAAMTRTSGGLGLGLAIVKQLVELHGGTISVESPGVNAGATFRVLLPLRAVRGPKASSPVAVRAPAPKRGEPRAEVNAGFGGALAGTRILLVEDQPTPRAAIRALLAAAGASVTDVGTATDALAALAQRKPDLLLSDIGLPGMDGHALMRHLRAEEAESQSRALRAVALTAFASAEDERAAVAAGYDRYLSKPFTSEALIATIRNLLDGV